MKPLYVFSGDSPWKDADADWFEQHPDRSHRMRKSRDGELEEMDSMPGNNYIIVRQLYPGVRVRMATCLLCLDQIFEQRLDDEYFAWKLFDHLAETYPVVHPFRLEDIALSADSLRQQMGMTQ